MVRIIAQRVSIDMEKIRSEHILAVMKTLARRYTKKADMDLGNPKDSLLGTLMSARTTDTQVLKILPAFTRRFPTFASLARSSPREIETLISSVGLYRSKAKAIFGLANMILDKFHGNVPGRYEDLIQLPGVGRKTANCVLAHVFGQATVCVDTHVFRIAHRLGWTKGKTPERVEQDLRTLVPKQRWSDINRTFIQFGRDACKPGKPQCWRCPVARWCAYHPKTLPPT